MNLLQKDKNKEKKRKEISKLREKGDHRSTDRKRRIHRDRPHRGSVVSDRLDLELSRPHSTPIYTKNVSSDNIKHIATSATDFSSGNVSGQRHPPTQILEIEKNVRITAASRIPIPPNRRRAGDALSLPQMRLSVHRRPHHR
ncbi:unnamed protein product [Brassica oleracea]